MNITIDLSILFVLALILVICIIIFIYKIKTLVKEDKKTKQENLKITDSNIALREEKQKIQTEVENLKTQKEMLTEEQSNITTSLTQIRNEIANQQQNMENIAKEAFDRYCEVLEKDYTEKNSEYDFLINKMQEAYSQKQDELKSEYDAILKELDAIRATREATIAAQIKEQEIKEKIDFYRLTPSLADLRDIELLNDIKPKLSKPRILSMLIWSTFFQKEMTALCNKILGLKTVVGIYKITNQQNDKCYIGQSVDVSKRWKDHAKCGLGIDTPAGNKLYKDMQNIGIWNFSWELLEECSKDALNDKERYYIELYQSKEYGYNTTKGVK